MAIFNRNDYPKKVSNRCAIDLLVFLLLVYLSVPYKHVHVQAFNSLLKWSMYRIKIARNTVYWCI